MASPRIEQARARFARVAFAEWLGVTVGAASGLTPLAEGEVFA